MKTLLLIFVLICGSAHAAAPVLDCTENRTTGTAPLVVVKDCKATTDDSLDAHQRFADVLYIHSCGIPDAGTWKNGSGSDGTGNVAGINSKNLVTGPVIACVYETPGTYTITTRAIDSGGLEDSERTTITVTAPNTTYSGTNTTCVSADSTPVAGSGGCPSGAAVVQQSAVHTILNTYKGTNKRILLKAGDTFTLSSQPSNFGVAGPSEFGSYGTANNGRAKIVCSASYSSFLFNFESGASDFRVKDIEVDGASCAQTMRLFVHDTPILNLLLLNNHFYSVPQCIAVDDNSNAGVYLVGNRFESVTGYRACTYVTGTNVAVIGNYINSGQLGEHPMRAAGVRSSVFSNNTLRGAPDGSQNGGNGKETFAIRQNGDTTPQYVIHSDNRYLVEGYSGFTVREDPQDIISERNYYATAGNTTLIEINGTYLRYRNEAVNATNSTGPIELRADDTGTDNANVRLENITIYSPTASASFKGIRLTATMAASTSNVIRNILQYTPNIVGENVVIDDDSAGATKQTNTGNIGSVTTNPFETTPTAELKTWRPSTAAYAATGGTASFPASNDDFFHCNDVTANEHIGAFVPRVRATCRGVK